jgi:hypothetical protein
MKTRFAAAFIAASSMASAATTISLVVDQWQGSFPYQWVEQTQASPGFTPGQEYAGFFSGLVTDGSGASTRYVFACTQVNTNITVGQTYQFAEYTPAEYLSTPFESNGTPLTTGEKQEIAGMYARVFGLGPPTGFTSPTAQSLIGWQSNATVQAILDSTPPDKAAEGQIWTWEVAQDTTKVVDFSAGSLQWTWQNGAPVHNDYPSMNITAVPETASAFATAMLLGGGLTIRRRFKK